MLNLVLSLRCKFLPNIILIVRNPISAVEAAIAAAVYVMLECKHPGMLAGRSVIHWVDNTSALYSLVKGGSKNEAIDRACTVAHFSAYYLRFVPWFEYVASDANWSDGASRDLLDDDLARLWFRADAW